ncbi:MAG: hypothetical protein J3K34DRAFT_527628 [Monoraphidium minutum]|nr:MAG: hypothetical protein J3K34DRAFT_527628 [Monoraphidium minutum]
MHAACHGRAESLSEARESQLNAPEYAHDEFRMYQFKVADCPNEEAHDWTECPFAHPGEKARRRDPRVFAYTGVACPDFRKGVCKRGDECTYGHGVFECWLHPSRYRTQLCKDGADCARRVCFFAHTEEEVRPSTLPPEAFAGAKGGAAADDAGSEASGPASEAGGAAAGGLAISRTSSCSDTAADSAAAKPAPPPAAAARARNASPPAKGGKARGGGVTGGKGAAPAQGAPRAARERRPSSSLIAVYAAATGGKAPLALPAAALPPDCGAAAAARAAAAAAALLPPAAGGCGGVGLDLLSAHAAQLGLAAVSAPFPDAALPLPPAWPPLGGGPAAFGPAAAGLPLPAAQHAHAAAGLLAGGAGAGDALFGAAAPQGLSVAPELDAGAAAWLAARQHALAAQAEAAMAALWQEEQQQQAAAAAAAAAALQLQWQRALADPLALAALRQQEQLQHSLLLAGSDLCLAHL